MALSLSCYVGQPNSRVNLEETFCFQFLCIVWFLLHKPVSLSITRRRQFAAQFCLANVYFIISTCQQRAHQPETTSSHLAMHVCIFKFNFPLTSPTNFKFSSKDDDGRSKAFPVKEKMQFWKLMNIYLNTATVDVLRIHSCTGTFTFCCGCVVHKS